MKNRITAALLALFLGWLGIHEFYLKRSKIKGIIFVVVNAIGIVTFLLSLIVPFLLLLSWIILIPYTIFLIIFIIWGVIDGTILLVMSDDEFEHRFNNKEGQDNKNSNQASQNLKNLGEMYQQGLISKEEYDSKKLELLKKI